MKNLYLAIIFSFTSFANAQSLNVDLDSVTLTDLIKITYGDLTDNDFIIDDELMKNQKKYTVKISDLNPKSMKPFLDSLLNREGYKIEKSHGIFSIYKRDKDSDLQTYVYTPKYRSSNEIINSIKLAFPVGTFGRNDSLTQNATNQDSMQTSGSSAFDNGLTNSPFVTVKGAAEIIERFKILVQSVDIPVPELMITTYIYEVSNDKQRENSLNLTASVLGSRLGFQTAGAVLESFLSVKTLGISAIISALNSDSRFKVVSSPFVRVKDKQKANFIVGSDVPVLGAIQNNGNGQTSQSVEYRKAGIILNIEPHIYSEQYELKINQELSNFVRTQTGVNNSPTLIKRSIDTVVNGSDDEVIILGGLDETRDTVSRSGFPLLPAFLHNTNKLNAKTSIIVVMHVKKSINANL